jgi:N-methylhydantoinase B
MRPGDVFFHNDVYRSEGGIGHLPDLCVTVPVFGQRGGADVGDRAGGSLGIRETPRTAAPASRQMT